MKDERFYEASQATEHRNQLPFSKNEILANLAPYSTETLLQHNPPAALWETGYDARLLGKPPIDPRGRNIGED